MICRIVPMENTSELAMSPDRRPSQEAMGQIRKQPKKAPPWRIETALELTFVLPVLE